ncbi:MAG TPA: right-handed parallel beta-helix repeat-containing protein, partial [Methanotrichaceae archaeon]|nr:right-handed parallel beta-helix repeat-containing protein [Methanotrichaceae archaeon]
FNFGLDGLPYYENDVDTSNLVDGKQIYYLINSSNLILDSSSNAGTVYCVGCHNVTARDLNLTNNSYGIYFLKTNDSRVENSSISDNWIGASFYNSSNDTVEDNRIFRNYIGIDLLNSSNVTLKDNLIYNNSFDELHRESLPAQKVKDKAVPEIVLEPLNLVLYSLLHGNFTGETPMGMPLGEEGMHPEEIQKSSPIPRGDGDGTGVPLQTERLPQLDYSAALEDAMKNLDVGKFIWNPPAEMEVGRTERVVALITRDLTVNLTEELRGRGVPQPEELINTSCTMKVSLSGSGNSFMIKSIGDETQAVGVGKNDITEWNWDVTPLVGGEQKLTIVATVILTIDGIRESHNLPVLERAVMVKVRPQSVVMEFMGKNWQWLAVTLVIPIITWFWRSRLQKKS